GGASWCFPIHFRNCAWVLKNVGFISRAPRGTGTAARLKASRSVRLVEGEPSVSWRASRPSRGGRAFQASLRCPILSICSPDSVPNHRLLNLVYPFTIMLNLKLALRTLVKTPFVTIVAI